MTHIFQRACVNCSTNVWSQPTTRQHNRAGTAHTHSWGVVDSIQAPPQTPMLSSQAGYSSVGRASDVESCSNQMVPGSIPCGRTSMQRHKFAIAVILWRQFGNRQVLKLSDLRRQSWPSSAWHGMHHGTKSGHGLVSSSQTMLVTKSGCWTWPPKNLTQKSGN